MTVITKVAIIGANGHLGPSILSALLSPHDNGAPFTVTVLSRASSKSTYPPSVHIHHLPDSSVPPPETLEAALRGQHALIMAFSGALSALQIALAEAASFAGSIRVIPADFGSCDSASDRACQTLDLFARKRNVRAHLQECAAQSNWRMSWTGLVCGHFFDWGLEPPSRLLGFDLKARKARVFDGGDVRWCASTLAQVGRAVVAVLRRPAETRDKLLYVQSFCVSQNEVLAALERATGGAKWEVEDVESEWFMREVKEKVDRDPGDHEAVEELVSALGIVEGDWRGRKGFAMELLGLEDEVMEDVVREVVGRLK